MEEASSENCNVKVAVNIRPFIGDEKLQGCKDCVAVTPGKPQVLSSVTLFHTLHSHILCVRKFSR